ncbi:MAG: beta-ketoacyl-ACP synthase III [Spirochaetota bacterium]|nr:beta-ketoacyl-ACP synthase III [Spirochaetota bacterium]
MGVYIRSIAAYVPQKRVSNDELAQSVDTSDEWIQSHTGIKNRHICADDEVTSDLGVKAAETAIQRADIDKSAIDMVIAATASPDYPGFPSTASIIQDKLGLENAGAFDLVAGCTGFVYGLETARGLLTGGRIRNVLVIGVETLSRITNWEDRNTCVLFGDGAGAAILSADEEQQDSILDSELRSEGSGAQHLIRPAGGSSNPIDFRTTPQDDLYIQMNGRQVYNFAVRVNTEIIQRLLERNSMTVDDLRWIVPHQANIRIIQAAAKRLKLPMEKFFTNIDEYANTSAASIPIALNELYETDRIKRGDYILLTGFGAGLTYGGNLLRW